METVFYESNRPFVIWDYWVGHSQLLLRSDKRRGYEHNIDIVFYGVSFMQISSTLESLRILITNDNAIINYPSVHEYLNYDTHCLFVLEHNVEKYYIAASFVKVFENDLGPGESALEYRNFINNKEILVSR